MPHTLTDDQIIDDVLRREGGYVHHPQDRGGCTNFGITQQTLSDWRGVPVSCADVECLTETEARAIYLRRYVEQPGFHHIRDDRLRALLVDYAVHSGPKAAVRALQAAVGVITDGVIGPKTVQAVTGADAAETYRRVLRHRGEHLIDLLQRYQSNQAFAAGWFRRVLEFV